MKKFSWVLTLVSLVFVLVALGGLSAQANAYRKMFDATALELTEAQANAEVLADRLNIQTGLVEELQLDRANLRGALDDALAENYKAKQAIDDVKADQFYRGAFAGCKTVLMVMKASKAVGPCQELVREVFITQDAHKKEWIGWDSPVPTRPQPEPQVPLGSDSKNS